MSYYNVRDFGASGNGVTLDTEKIQNSINTCSNSGGGVVLIPPGIYKIGTLFLKSHVTIELSNGAMLLASRDIKDYTAVKLWDDEKRKPFVNPDLQPYHLIVASNCKSIELKGQGKIKAPGDAFWEIPQPPNTWIPAKVPRVSPTICIHHCFDVKLTNFSIEDSSGWTIECNSCERVWIQSLRIKNNFWGPNTDGIDIQGCKDVIISNCNIDCSDDAICLKTLPDSLPNERITITNCICRTQCVGLKLGCLEAFKDMKQIVFSNCVIYDCTRGIGVYSLAGGNIENVLFENITIYTNPFWELNRPIHVDLRISKQLPQNIPIGSIKNIRFNNIHCKTQGRILMTARPGAMLKNIFLSNIHIQYDVIDDPYPKGRNARGNQFSNDNPEAREARAAVVAENINNLSIQNLSVEWPENYSGPPFPVVWGKNLKGGFLDNPLANQSHKNIDKYQLFESDIKNIRT